MSRREPLPARGERVAERKARALEIVRRLEHAYPDARTALNWYTSWQLLVATILSAQCTDERVNQTTPALFEAYPGPSHMADADLDELETLVQPTGFFRQKAKNLRATARRVCEVYGGEVPETIEEITTLPGAARKTANVVISNCFPDNVAGVAVDTHVQRVARRLALTRAFPPDQIERELTRVIPREHWNQITNLLIAHGRATCTAHRPRCEECVLRDLCPSAERFLQAVPSKAARPRTR